MAQAKKKAIDTSKNNTVEETPVVAETPPVVETVKPAKKAAAKKTTAKKTAPKKAATKAKTSPVEKAPAVSPVEKVKAITGRTDVKVEDLTAFFSIQFRGFGGNRKLKQTQYETAADKQRTGAFMRLVQGPELMLINQIRHRTRNMLCRLAVPSPLGAQKGVYLMPVSLLERARNECVKNKAEWEDAWQEFLAVYPKLKEQAKLPRDQGGLDELYNEKLFPTVQELDRKRRFAWMIYEQVIPGGKLTEAIKQDEMDKLREGWRESGAQIRSALRQGLAELVDKMVYSLGADEDGKARAFHSSLYEKVNEFLEVIDARNIVGDAELRSLTDQAREVMSMVSTSDQLKAKGDADLREKVLAKFAKLSAVVNNFVEVKDGRAFGDDDEED